MFNNFEDVESDIESIGTEMKENKAEEADLQSRLESIDSALKSLEGDSTIQDKITEKKENREQDIERNHEKRDTISQRIGNLINSLEIQREENNQSGQALSSLEQIGEDVSEGKGIVEQRDRFIEESIRKLMEIDERSGELFEFADQKIEEAFNDEKTPSQKKRDEFRESLKVEVDDKPRNPDESIRKSNNDIYKNEPQRNIYGERSKFFNDSSIKLLNLIPGFNANKRDYEEDIKIVNSILNDTKNPNIRSLAFTEQSWHIDVDGNEVFNSPNETGNKLDWNQGKYINENNMVIDGTCGIVSCVNVARLAGDNYAKEINYVPDALKNGYCSKDGGTDCLGRQRILAAHGINSTIESCTVDSIASRVSEGKGVIISVDASQLWFGQPNPEAGHAVTVTSVKRDSLGNVLGFYICDSGKHQTGSAYYEAKEIRTALTGRPMNVTTNIIR